MGLLNNTSNRPNRNFTLLRHDHYIGVFLGAPDEFNMASALSRLEKTNRFQSPLYLAER